MCSLSKSDTEKRVKTPNMPCIWSSIPTLMGGTPLGKERKGKSVKPVATWKK